MSMKVSTLSLWYSRENRLIQKINQKEPTSDNTSLFNKLFTVVIYPLGLLANVPDPSDHFNGSLKL